MTKQEAIKKLKELMLSDKVQDADSLEALAMAIAHLGAYEDECAECRVE